MVVEAIDLFNKRLVSIDVGSQLILDDEVEKIETNYSLYIAKKKGTPKDDFPGKFKIFNVFNQFYDFLQDYL